MNQLRSERPLWLRWVLAVTAFSLLAAVILVAVHQLNHSGGAATDTQAARQANQEGRALIAQDQAPREAMLARRAAPGAALAAAVTADVRAQVRNRQLAGPVGAVRCRARGRRRGRRVPYRCAAAAGAVSYTFLAVADLSARRLVWCRRDDVPGSGLAVALNPACLP